MKSLQEIENISFDKLEEIAQDSAVKVPKDLKASVKSAVAAAAMGEASSARPARRPLWRPYALLSVFAAACIGVFFATPRTPKDTYDDPLIAYAKVEETFALISSKLDRGVESVRQVEEPLETVNRIINNSR
ncbi:MAG: hypothetical protein J6W07_02695 [Bacteroidales bacterium]|nr:hypothetical protein [Bacteroidales bacterium]MBP5795734.1 hypothetical protein [Bacteroidales bacterium]